jgi:hypothetical protein
VNQLYVIAVVGCFAKRNSHFSLIRPVASVLVARDLLFLPLLSVLLLLPNRPTKEMSRRTRGSSTSGLVGAFQDRQDPAKPQILTASTLAALTSGLDASDTLECYLLTREARLDGIANSTLPVHKLALGIRYNPSQQSSSVGRRKKPLEITLEYGPARAGEGLLLETVPRVGGRGSESGNHNNKNSKNRRRAATGTAADADDPSSVAWDNRAVVYYTLRIDGYRGADYVASMTGAVLKNLLQTALAYPLQRSRRRYQPFAVHRRAPQQSAPGASSSTTTTTEESGAASASSSSSSSQQPQASEVMVLRSSNDLDFVSALWQHLSEVGVELKPVILPIRWRVHLVASGIRKVVAAGPGPAAAPATKNDASSSSSSTSATPPEGTGAGGTVPMHSVAAFYQRLYLCIEAIATANYSAYDAAAAPANATAGRLLAADAPAQLPPPQAEEGESDTDGTAPAPDSLDEIDDLEVNVTNADAMEEGGGAPEPQLPGQDSSAGQGPPVDTDQVAQDAQQAAQDAETAAHQAQHSGNEQAAQAAQAAADAAKKAADSTRGQAAMVAQKALLSGDGSSMAETISQCLSSPRYGISRNDSNTTTVYLYVAMLSCPTLLIRIFRFTARFSHLSSYAAASCSAIGMATRTTQST